MGKVQIMEQDGFLSYLKKEKKLSPRSAKDVISRIKRANTFVNVDSKKNYNSIVIQLERINEFSDLSQYVKPQIKRAVFLYKEYLNSKSKS